MNYIHKKFNWNTLDLLDTLANSAVVASKTNFGGNYSMSEVDTGFKYSDGKAIYKKTFNGSHTTNTVLNILVSSGIDSLVDSTGWTTFEGTMVSLGKPRYINTASLYYASSVIKVVSSGNISLYTTGTSSGANTHSVTLYYTKV